MNFYYWLKIMLNIIIMNVNFVIFGCIKTKSKYYENFVLLGIMRNIYGKIDLF